MAWWTPKSSSREMRNDGVERAGPVRCRTVQFVNNVARQRQTQPGGVLPGKIRVNHRRGAVDALRLET